MPHRQSPRGRCLAALAATLLLATCGLPTPRPVLDPPSNPVALDSRDEFRFEQPKPPKEFLGYEIYYKLFDEPAELEPGLDSRSQLENRGFLRLTRAGDGATRPLIPAPTRGHAVVLSFAPIGRGSPPTARVDEMASIPLRRGVRDAFGNLRKFEDCSHYAQEHRDLVAVYDSITRDGCADTSIQIQLYVISYGTWESPLRHKLELWSDALFLDSITVALPRDV